MVPRRLGKRDVESCHAANARGSLGISRAVVPARKQSIMGEYVMWRRGGEVEC